MMVLRYGLLLLLAFPLTGLADVYALKSRAFVMGAQYSLLDVLDASALPKSEQSELDAIPVGLSPRPGQSVWVTQRDVIRRLRQERGAAAQDVQFAGKERTQVTSIGVEHSVAGALKGAKAVLDAWLAQRYGQFSSRLVNAPETIMTYSGRVEFRSHVKESVRLSKRMRVLLDVIVDGTHYTTVPLWFDVSVTEPGWILEEPAKAHELVNMAVLRREDVDVASLQGRPFRGDLSHLRYAHARSEGAVLKVKDVEPLPAVTAGEQIKVVVKYGVVTLVAKAEAITDGQVHDRIRVKSLSSGKSYLARVTGTAEAKVE